MTCHRTSTGRTFSTSVIQREVIHAHGQIGSNQKSAMSRSDTTQHPLETLGDDASTFSSPLRRREPISTDVRGNPRSGRPGGVGLLVRGLVLGLVRGLVLGLVLATSRA